MFEEVTGRGLILKPFALEGCPPSCITEFGVLFIFKLLMFEFCLLFLYSFIFEFLFSYHSAVSRVVVFFSVSFYLSRIARRASSM